MTFKKGEVSNPRGRGSPNSVASALRKRVAVLARMHTEEGVETLVEIMRSEDAEPLMRLKAADHILDRGWGRPPVATSLYFEDDVPQQDGANEESVLPVLASILADIAEQEEKRARKLEAEQPQTEDAGR